MKPLKAAFTLVAVLGMIAFAAASLWLGRGVKLAVESRGPGIVGAPVTVGTVILVPWSGRGSVSNLVIGNPPGFKGAHALSVGSVEVKIKLASLVTDTIVVESVVVRDPEILYETGAGGSNLSRLQRNAQGAKTQGGSAGSSGGKSLFIKDLVVSGGRIGVAASVLGRESLKVSMPEVRLRNLGGKGRSPADAAAEVLGAISSSAARAVTAVGTKAISGAAATVMGKLGGLFKGEK